MGQLAARPDQYEPANEISPIIRLHIFPGYAKGFSYAWELNGEFNDPAPWTFTIQFGPDPDGPWRDVSPELINVVSWHDSGGKFLVGKSNTLYFRMRVRTPNGTYFSHPVQPYGDLSRRDYLLAREIMRRESLRARVLAGMDCDVYIKSTFGPRCTFCMDPVTYDVRDSQCRHCFGTGRLPAYYGPHRMALSFSPDVAHSKDNAQDGTHESKMFEALTIGNPVLKKGDVVVDRRSDKRYVVGAASMVAEVRRIPCLQKLAFCEAPLNDPVYSIGAESHG